MRDLLKTEDWWAVWIGLFLVGLSLLGVQGFHALGFGISTSEWLDVSKAMAPSSAASYPALPGWGSLLVTYVFLLIVLCIGAAAMGWDVPRFAGSFTVIFAVSYACVLIGNYAYIATTPDKFLAAGGKAKARASSRSAGRSVSPVRPVTSSPWRRDSSSATSSRRIGAALVPGARSEWFIKTAIVILGLGLGVKAAGAATLTSAILFRGFAAIVEAYLIYWGGWSISSPASSSGSAASGRRRWRRGFRFAACRRPSPPGPPFGRGRLCRSWCRRWSSSLR